MLNILFGLLWKINVFIWFWFRFRQARGTQNSSLNDQLQNQSKNTSDDYSVLSESACTYIYSGSGPNSSKEIIHNTTHTPDQQ